MNPGGFLLSISLTRYVRKSSPARSELSEVVGHDTLTSMGP